MRITFGQISLCICAGNETRYTEYACVMRYSGRCSVRARGVVVLTQRRFNCRVLCAKRSLALRAGVPGPWSVWCLRPRPRPCLCQRPWLRLRFCASKTQTPTRPNTHPDTMSALEHEIDLNRDQQCRLSTSHLIPCISNLPCSHPLHPSF